LGIECETNWILEIGSSEIWRLFDSVINKGSLHDMIMEAQKGDGSMASNNSETGIRSFRCDIPVVFYKLNTKYITISQNAAK